MGKALISSSSMISKFFYHSSVIPLFITVQSEVFGMPSNENGENPEALQEDTDFDRVKAQRAAKRARLAIASEEVS